MAPRQSVVGVIVHKGDVLMLLRSADDRSFPGLWCFPGGKIDDGEDALTAICREVYEETGLQTKDTPWARVHWASLVQDVDAGTHVIDAFILVLTGAKLNHPTVQLSPEHTHYCWVSPTGALSTLPLGPATRTIMERARDVLALATEGG